MYMVCVLSKLQLLMQWWHVCWYPFSYTKLQTKPIEAKINTTTILSQSLLLLFLNKEKCKNESKDLNGKQA